MNITNFYDFIIFNKNDIIKTLIFMDISFGKQVINLKNVAEKVFIFQALTFFKNILTHSGLFLCKICGEKNYYTYRLSHMLQQ